MAFKTGKQQKAGDKAPPVKSAPKAPPKDAAPPAPPSQSHPARTSQGNDRYDPTLDRLIYRQEIADGEGGTGRWVWEVRVYNEQSFRVVFFREFWGRDSAWHRAFDDGETEEERKVPCYKHKQYKSGIFKMPLAVAQNLAEFWAEAEKAGEAPF